MKLIKIAVLLLTLPFTPLAFAEINLNDWLKNNHCEVAVKLTQHDYNFFNRPVAYRSFAVGNAEKKEEISFQEGVWQISYQTKVPENRKDMLEVELHCKLVKGSAPQTSIAIDFTFDKWSRENYVLMPAAATSGRTSR
jgi:hypothetical protein